MAQLHFGITGGARPWLGELARSLEALGYEGAWANDTPGHSGIAAVAALGAAPGPVLGVGVISVADHEPAAIAASVRDSGVQRSRLILGVGSGGSRSLAFVREGVTALRRELPDVRIGVAALGPRMCELGGEVADVVLLNWATPAQIAWARERIAAGATRAKRLMPAVAAYVRVAVGPGAVERLEKERRRYTRIPSYARMFEAEGGAPGIARATGSVAAELRQYREALDICVVRGLPAADTLDGWLAVAEAAV